MKSVIEKLWHGDILPQKDSRDTSPEIKYIIKQIAIHHDELLKIMTDEQKAIFKNFDDCLNKYECLSEEAIFTYAFRLGANFMMDSLTEKQI